MASRASIAAGVILLISLVVVFVLVADNGVSTGVYLPDQPTHTPAPTAGPSPTPLPDPAVENWQENTPGQLSYVPRPESGAQVFYNVTTLEEFAGNLGIDPPADDAPSPALNVLQAMREGFEEQIAELGLDAGPEAIDGPATVLVGGMPVSRLRIQLDAAETDNDPFPGLDLVIGIIDRPGDEVQLVQYRLQAPPDPAIYNDFRAWLEARAVELSGVEATETPTGDDATDQPDAEGEDAPADEPSDDAEAPAEEAAAPDDAGEATASSPWTELTPGILIYGADPSIAAQIVYNTSAVDQFIASNALEPAAEGSETPALDAVEQLRDMLAEQFSEQGIPVDQAAFTGPEAVEVAGKPGARLRVSVPAATLENGQPFPGLDVAIVLVQVPDDQIAAIQYTYQGAPEASVYAEFEAWLAENAERATEPVTADAAPAEEAPAGEAESPEADAEETGSEETDAD